jgi:hypothetical protein
MAAEKTQPFCLCSRALNRSGKGLRNVEVTDAFDFFHGKYLLETLSLYGS